MLYVVQINSGTGFVVEQYTTAHYGVSYGSMEETNENGHLSQNEALSTMMEKEAARASKQCRIAIASGFEKLNKWLQEAISDNYEEKLEILRKMQQNAPKKDKGKFPNCPKNDTTLPKWPRNPCDLCDLCNLCNL
ncbi:hypothetical protein Tco_0089933 [Tanacetum coccineum]